MFKIYYTQHNVLSLKQWCVLFSVFVRQKLKKEEEENQSKGRYPMGLTKSLILDSEWPKRILVEASGSPKEGCSHTGEQEGNIVLYNQPKSSHTRSLAISGGFASFFPRLPPEVLLYIHLLY